ncbi:MAG: hypothetical protein K8S54_06625 [Spirochaetia bacterium]|nr:hypothetical protein [Spirochaetia bacterium]
MNRDFALIGGIILLFAFGTLLPFAYLQIATESNLTQALATSNSRVFVTLVKRQSRFNLTGERFFFSIEFQLKGKKQKMPVEVNADFYHLQKEGKNLEATLYMDRGRPYVLLPGSTVESTHSWILFWMSAGFAFLGALLVGISRFLKLDSNE